MLESIPLHDQCLILIDGRSASSQVMDAILRISVEEGLHLPAMCQVAIFDDDLEIVDGSSLKIGSELEVELGHGNDLEEIFTGEIVALELRQSANGVFHLIARAYDRSHRLHRGRRSRPFIQVTDSDVAGQIAGEAGLRSDIESTREVHDYILQNNQTSYQFLRERAERIGFSFWVTEGVLHFRRLSAVPPMPVVLEWGATLLNFNASLNSSRQVDEVIVRGWDAKTKQSVTGQAMKGRGVAETGQRKMGGNTVHTVFGQAHQIVVDSPIRSQAEADSLAQSVSDGLDGDFIQAEGRCLGMSKIRPGSLLEIRNVGKRFGGRYYVTRTTHSISNRSGYVTEFTAAGSQAQTLLDLLKTPGQKPAGVCIGVVTDNHDPENMGRVKVQFPWLGDQVESTWARLVAPMAGKGRGLMALPEIRDEVLVAFDHEDVHQPYILGALWNLEDTPPIDIEKAVDQSGQVVQRVFCSRAGHMILLDDTGSQEKMEIRDCSGARIVLDRSGIEVRRGRQTLKVSNSSITLNDGALEVT